MDLSEIQNTILDRRIKGIPGSSEPFPLKELKNKNWNILKAVSYTHLTLPTNREV